MAIETENKATEININPALGKTKISEIEQIVQTNYLKLKNLDRKKHEHEMKINLTNHTPFHTTPRRLSYKEREELKKITDQLLTEGIVRHSNSPYASPVVLVRKKNGEYRKCVDYRTLNKLTIRDNFPLPLIEDSLEYFAEKKSFRKWTYETDSSTSTWQTVRQNTPHS